jgi:hypothetical protein
VSVQVKRIIQVIVTVHFPGESNFGLNRMINTTLGVENNAKESHTLTSSNGLIVVYSLESEGFLAFREGLGESIVLRRFGCSLRGETADEKNI